MPIPLISPMITESVSQMLWDFGFRHHPEFQTKWISGVAGLGTLADMVDEKPLVNTRTQLALKFLEETNPELYERVRGTTDIDHLDMETLGDSFAAIAALIKEIQK